MLEKIEPAPPDAILGIAAAFREDNRPEKINLSVGIYQDETGVTPTLECVKAAEIALAEISVTKSYLPIPGSPEYTQVVRELQFGEGHEVIESNCLATAHTPGGTGALRVVGDFLHTTLPKMTLWMTTPTWANHPNIFQAAGVPTRSFTYFDASKNELDFAGMMAAVKEIPSGDAILLHSCCHNPTGVDPSPEQWQEIAEVVHDRGLLPILDFAYQGFANGIEEDALGMRKFLRPGKDLLVCSSFSKNFGLYRERVGALSVVAPDQESARRVQSQINRVIRSNYSNPPAHGADIVNYILRDQSLRSTWEQEVAAMRNRINGLRQQLVEELAAKGVSRDYSFITNQRGMFSFTGLSKEQVDTLRQEDALYIVGSGRINVAGLTSANIGRVAEAIARVV